MSPKDLALLNDLRCQVDKFDLTPGNVIVITPRLTELAFTPQYSQWLGYHLQQFIPQNVKWMILQEPLSINSVGKPTEQDEAYVRGWQDCVSSLVATKELEYQP